MPTMVEIWKAEGAAEGKAEGKVEGVVRAILRTLTRNFGTVPESISARVQAVTNIDKLDELLDMAYDCADLDEFEKAVP